MDAALYKDLIDQLNSKEEISDNLREKLLNLTLEERTLCCKNIENERSALYKACFNDNYQTAKFLLEKCGADVNQIGLYIFNIYATPLWLAAYNGNLPLVKLLIKHGANVNNSSEIIGSTALSIACTMLHYKVVKYLIKKGASILLSRRNDGMTCLMSCIGSIRISRFLLKHGANVNEQDIHFKTVLHYVVDDDYLKMFKFFINNTKADVTVCNEDNDDILQYVCLRRAKQIFKYIMDNKNKFKYSKQRIADAYELMGAICIKYYESIEEANYYWEFAGQYRRKKSLYPKIDINQNNDEVTKTLAANVYQDWFPEFIHEDQITFISYNRQFVTELSIVIQNRILGAHHKVTIDSLLTFMNHFGVTNADEQLSNNIWLFISKILFNKFSLIFTIEHLNKISDFNNFKFYINAIQMHDIPYDHYIMLINFLVNELERSMKLLSIGPVNEDEYQSFDTFLTLIFMQLNFLFQNDLADEECVKKAIAINPRKYRGKSFLHLAVKPVVIKNPIILFHTNLYTPSYDFIKFLIESKVNINAITIEGKTPLHYASSTSPTIFNPAIVKLLLRSGAYINLPDYNDRTPYQILSTRRYISYALDWTNYTTAVPLQLLIATFIRKNKIPYSGLPDKLIDFIENV